jgi:hypothetical protein
MYLRLVHYRFQMNEIDELKSIRREYRKVTIQSCVLRNDCNLRRYRIDKCIYDVNYYIDGGDTARNLDQTVPTGTEIKTQMGRQKRRWLVSNLKAKDISIYFSGEL